MSLSVSMNSELWPAPRQAKNGHSYGDGGDGSGATSSDFRKLVSVAKKDFSLAETLL